MKIFYIIRMMQANHEQTTAGYQRDETAQREYRTNSDDNHEFHSDKSSEGNTDKSDIENQSPESKKGAKKMEDGMIESKKT